MVFQSQPTAATLSTKPATTGPLLKLVQTESPSAAASTAGGKFASNRIFWTLERLKTHSVYLPVTSGTLSWPLFAFYVSIATAESTSNEKGTHEPAEVSRRGCEIPEWRFAQPLLQSFPPLSNITSGRKV